MDVIEANNLFEEALSLKNIMVARATGEQTSDAAYQQKRRLLLLNPKIRNRLPRLVRTCRTLGEFWGAIKTKLATYQERRDFLQEEFEPVLSYLEDLTLVPPDSAVQNGPKAADGDGVDAVVPTHSPQANQKPRVFIGYAWEDDTKAFVVKLAKALQVAGFEVTYDQESLMYGDYLPEFMESLSSHEFILTVLSPKYKDKANSRAGGVGYESRLISAAISQEKKAPRQIVPILYKGSSSTSVPEFLSGKKFVNFVENQFEGELASLVQHIQRVSATESGSVGSTEPAPAVVAPTPHLKLGASKLEARPQSVSTETTKPWLEVLVTYTLINHSGLPINGAYLRVSEMQAPQTGEMRVGSANFADWEVVGSDPNCFALNSKRAIFPNESVTTFRLSLKVHKPFSDVSIGIEGGSSNLKVQELAGISISKDQFQAAWDAQKRHHYNTSCSYPREPMERLFVEAFPGAEISWSIRP